MRLAHIVRIRFTAAKEIRLSELTPSQRQAAECITKPAIVLAGAGSGKTTVLVSRYLELLKTGAKPSSVLTVTFTTDAANEMQSRIILALQERHAESSLIEAVENCASLGTIHSFCYRFLKRFGSLLDLPPLSGIVGACDHHFHFESAYESWLNQLPPHALELLMARFGRYALKDAIREYLDLDEPTQKPTDPKTESLLTLLKETTTPLRAQLEQASWHHGLVTFDDLERLTLRILKQHPDVQQRLQQEISHVMIDEFQDTSPMQWEIFQSLIGDQWQKLFIVGDPKQSIYGFRHADVGLFLTLKDKLPELGAESFELNTNFRSKPRLLSAIDTLAARWFAKGPIPFEPMEPGSEGESYFEVCSYPDDDKDPVGRERALLKEKVSKLLDQGVRPTDIAVLFRVSDRMPLFQQTLEELGIAVSCQRSMRLNQSYDFLDILAFLRVLTDPLDDYWLSAFLSTPYIGLSFQDLWDLQQKDGDTLFDKMLLNSGPRTKPLISILEKGSTQATKALSDLFSLTHAFPDTGAALLTLLKQMPSTTMNVAALTQWITGWENYSILIDPELLAKPTQALELSTIHGAKGLEYEHVFLVDLNRRSSTRAGHFLKLASGEIAIRDSENDNPHFELALKSLRQKDEDESKRLSYVAVTRAITSLTIIAPESHTVSVT